MSAIGSLVFCTDCGDLLPASQGSEKNILTCECCGAENKDIGTKTIVSESKDSDFPSLLRRKLQSNLQVVERHKVDTEQIDPNMECSECGRTGVRFSAVQLRSADEGSTIFYNCVCGHKWTMNN